MTDIYKHILELTVLSEDEDISNLSLEDIAYETDCGSMIGQLKVRKVIELSRNDAIQATYDLGSEPSFFNLEEDVD